MYHQKYLLIFCLAIIFCSSVSTMAVAKDDAVSPATLQQMELIENSIDKEIQPCDDFYDYACGNWENQKFAQGTNESNHEILKINFLQEIKNMLNNDFPDKDHLKTEDQSYVDKVMAFYYSCKNKKNTEIFKNLKPSKDIEWPMIDILEGKPKSSMDNFDVFIFLGQIFSYGIDNFVVGRYVHREKNGSLQIQVNVPQPAESNIKYLTHNTIEHIGLSTEKDNEDTAEILRDVESSDSNWLATYKEYNKDNSQSFTYGEIKQLYPQLSKFISEMLSHQVDDSDTVVVQNIKYIDFLIAKEWQPEELRKLCNYAMVQLYSYFTDNNDGDCDNLVRKKMHLGVNHMYRQRYVTPDVLAAFNDLREKIYKYLLEDVNENQLELTTEQLKAINDKLARIYINIGNVPHNANDAMVDEFYRHMPDMDVNNLSQNLWWALKQRFWETFNCPEHMECLEEIGLGVYNVLENDLVIISLATMKPFMYDVTYDPILAVSLMGLFIGHEYGHSIDTNALMATSLYGPMHEEFKNNPNIKASIECTNEQFPTHYLRQLQVDLLGARAAYRVYETEYKGLQPSFTEIPWQQIFFLNFAQFFCQWKRYDSAPLVGSVRSNHVARNMDEFGQAFNCPADWSARKTCYLY